MQQANSPQPFKRRSSPSQVSHAQNSQPIQPLKLPPFRPLTAAAPPVSHFTPPAYSSKNSVADESTADQIGRRTAVLPDSVPNVPKLLDRQDIDRQNNVGVMLEPSRQRIQRVQQPIRQQIQRQRKSWEWSLIGLVAVTGILGGIGTSAMLWLSSLPPLPKCEKITLRSLDVQRLFCAQATADSGKLQDLLTGINLLKDWSPDHPLKPEAQRLIARWSKEILTIAQEKINHNDIKGAVVTARQVPSSSPAYAEAQTAIVHWQAQWQKGEATIKIAQNAMQQKNWTQASKQVLVLGELESAYWRLQRADELSRQILDGKQAEQALLEAQKLKAQKLEAQKVTQSGQPQGWEGAIAPITEQAAELTQSSTGEAPSSAEDSQPVESESTESAAPSSSEVSSEIAPTNAAPEKSFEGYYDERYFENSY